MTKATVLAKGTEMIISGLISKIDNNLVDFGWKKIKDANSERKAHEQNIETRIYQVTVDAINAFTFDTYKNQDILYIAAESILGGFKSKKDKIEAVKTGLKMLEPQITDDRCADFLGTLCDEICKDENDILYKGIVLMQQQQTLREIRRGFEENTHNQGTVLEVLDDVKEDTRYIREILDNKVNEVEHHSEMHIQNRAEEYAEKWEKNVFLNDFNKRDKNAGVNIKLKDIYLEEQLPHYTWKTDNEPLSDLKELLKEYTVDNDGKNMLLILGQPGIGKSTLITWIMANFREKKKDFLVYQFASDLRNVNWQGNDILKNMLNKLNLKYGELENKILIFDGFDEICTSGDKKKILNQMHFKLKEMNYIKNISIIITCRQNYVQELSKLECDFITLHVWDDEQIQGFCRAYGEICKNNIPQRTFQWILFNKRIFGIPLILYMIVSLNIIVEESSSLVDIYDQIFSIDRGSIYDRCINNARYGAAHRISATDIKRQIYHISQRIAFWIFENNPEKAFIPRLKFEEICDAVIDEMSEGDKEIKNDILIGNYFKLIRYCEGIGTEELHFVHRSIYEYFVTVFFFESLYKVQSEKVAAGILGELLKDGRLHGYWYSQFLEFIKKKFECISRYNLMDTTRNIFQRMLHDGMTYYINKHYDNIIVREMNIFANMLEIVCLWNSSLGELDEKIITYLQYNKWEKLNLKGVRLKCVNLEKVNLVGANLSEAELIGVNLSAADLSKARLVGADLLRASLREANVSNADLERANLLGVDLAKADLSKTNLKGANLKGANLSEANLLGADLSETNLLGANLRETLLNEEQVKLLSNKYDLNDSIVFDYKTNKIISYKQYCTRNSQEKMQKDNF